MRAALVYMGTATGESSVLGLGDYTSTGKNAITLDIQRDFRTGMVSSLIVQHSVDGLSAWATLHDFGDLSGLKSVTLYTWCKFLKMAVTYAEDATADDPGLRAAVGVHVWGPPEWNMASVCRSEHIKALYPAIVDTNKSFNADWPDQAGAAKREIELILRAKGVDPYTIFTDGHSTKPTPEGLESAGAALTICNLLGAGAAVYGEGLKDARGHFQSVYESQIETWLLGAAQVDKEADGRPDDTDAMSIGLELRW
jgi:hypothetical protein